MSDIDIMKDLIERADKLIEARATYSEPEFEAWKTFVERFLIKKYGEASVEYKNFHERAFGPLIFSFEDDLDDSIECIHDIKTTKLELQGYLSEEQESAKTTLTSDSHLNSQEKIFIIHGHDGELKQEVARMIGKQGIKAVILNEQPSLGKTIIEKIEECSDVGAAIALFTCDDYTENDGKAIPRARQNVLFETGFLMGKLGRDRVIVIMEDGVEIPSDLNGVVYSNKSNWMIDVFRDLKEMNYPIDLNKLS